MQNSVYLSLLALGLGVMALAFSFADRRPLAPQGAEAWVHGDRAVTDRILRLEQENEALRDRLGALEAGPRLAPVARTPATEGWVSLDEFEALRAEVRNALEASAGPATRLDADPAAFREQLVETLDELRRAEAVAKAESVQAARRDEFEAAMPKLESWLELTRQQSAELHSALLTQFERDAELTRRWNAGEDAAVLGEVKRADREAHWAELAGILTPQQLETYSADRLGNGK